MLSATRARCSARCSSFAEFLSRRLASPSVCCTADFPRFFSPGTELAPLGERVQAIHERADRAVEARDLRVVRLDHVVLVGRVRAVAEAHAEAARRELE